VVVGKGPQGGSKNVVMDDTTHTKSNDGVQSEELTVNQCASKYNKSPKEICGIVVSSASHDNDPI
jgi:hypothetical protein